MSQEEIEERNLELVRKWCAEKGDDWKVLKQLGRGGTAPVYSVSSPDGELAFKLYDEEFSSKEKGKIEEARVERQVALGRHGCPSLIEVYEGARFEDRLFVLMNRAPGRELEKVLQEVPRDKIRTILHQVAMAAAFLRENGLCHRDIKSANVFVSDDFTRATLLDLSVTRQIFDPLGIGTDHDGQLPIVATARYSPPEYLFRLMDPGPELWHALDIYQLGALLHDLIMRRPLFEDEYLHSKENRYRFAWTVATVDPTIDANDVDYDLLFLARRALDKNWKQRSSLQLKDFFQDAASDRTRAMLALGLAGPQNQGQATTNTASERRQRLRSLSAELEEGLIQHLQKRGITARHLIEFETSDRKRELIFQWERTLSDEIAPTRFDLRLAIELADSIQGPSFSSSVRLTCVKDELERNATVQLPQVSDTRDAEKLLREHTEQAFPELARQIVSVPEGR